MAPKLICFPNIVLKSALPYGSPTLNVGHINADGLRPKIDEFRRIIKGVNMHCVAVSETHFKSYVSNKSVEVEGYNLLRNDRPLRRKGGVALYVKKSLRTRVISESASVIGNLEYLFVELCLGSHKILLGVLYKPPKVNDIDKLDDLLQRLSISYSEILLAGDFNEDIIAKTGKTRRYMSVIEEKSLRFVSAEPTHFSSTTSTAIDHFITSSISNVSRFSQISLPGISKHDLIFLSLKCDMNHVTRPLRMSRRLNCVNLNDLMSDASRVDWSSLAAIDGVDSLVEGFSDRVLESLDHHAPLLPVVSKESHNPWFTPVVSKSIVDRDLAYVAWKRDRTDVNFCRFKLLRNRATQAASMAKKKYFAKKFGRVTPTRNLWGGLRDLGFLPDSGDLAPPFTADEFNAHFVGRDTYSEFPRVVNLGVVPVLNSAERPNSSFSFRGITAPEVVKAISSVKSKSVGTDSIPIGFIRMLLPFVLPVITRICNSIITKSSFPVHWKTAKVLPRHKKSRHHTLNDYRPISILPSISKVLERMVKWQISEHLKENDLLFEFQSGFRAGYSTASALLKVTNDIRTNLSKNVATVLLLLDFSKAFDSVSHRLLLSKLKARFGFTADAARLIESYLSGRSQSVCVNGFHSQLLGISCGIPQGSVLGPILFSMFINDLPERLKHSESHLFADDFQLYKTVREDNISLDMCLLKSDLDVVSSWAKENRLGLNATKTKAIIFSSSGWVKDIPDVVFEGVQLKFVDSVKNLGLTLEGGLDWEPHARLVSSKIFAGLRNMWPSARHIPVSTRATLVRALLLPHFTYCCPVLGKLSARARNVFEKAFNACIRFVYGIGRYESITDYSDRLLGRDLFTYLDYMTSSFLHNVIVSKEPSYVYGNLTFGHSRRMCNLILPRNDRDIINSSLYVHGVSKYNSLPNAIKRQHSLTGFQRACKDFLGLKNS